MISVTINVNDAGQRLDKYLTKAFPKLPKSLQNKYIRIKRIKRNQKRCYPGDILEKGDVLELYINDELLVQNETPLDFLHAAPLSDIIYEDDNILLVNKPAGLLVHEDDGSGSDTLINRIKKYLFASHSFDPENERSFAPALCNRIDRNTCGIVIAAKNAPALRILNQKIKDHELQKKYTLIVCRTLPHKSGTMTNFLLKDSKKNCVSVFDKPVPGGRKAITTYHVLEEKKKYTLVEAQLHTGRTHQLRAQFANMGNPIAGDAKYGHPLVVDHKKIDWQLLCSSSLTFSFTTDAENLSYLSGKTFTVPHIWFMDEIWPKLS